MCQNYCYRSTHPMSLLMLMRGIQSSHPYMLANINERHIFPRKLTNTSNTQSFSFSVLFHSRTEQLYKIPYYSICWSSTLNHLPQNPFLLYCLSGHIRKKNILGFIKSVCLNLTDDNSTIILSLISTSFCVIFI